MNHETYQVETRKYVRATLGLATVEEELAPSFFRALGACGRVGRGKVLERFKTGLFQRTTV